MKLGAAMLPSDVIQLRQWARMADDGGFDYLGFADSQSLHPEVYVALALAATETSRLHLGPAVTNPITRHPAIIASAIAALYQATGGRAFLGVGGGDSAVLNLGLAPARVAQLREFLTCMRALLSGESCQYQGKRIHTRWAKANVPLVLAAEGPRTLHLAGELADAAIVHAGLTPEFLEPAIAAVREGERAAGRPPGSVQIWAFANCRIEDTRKAALDQIKSALAHSAHHYFRFTLDGKGVPPELEEPLLTLLREYDTATEHARPGTRSADLPDRLGLTDFLAERFAVAGTPEDCQRQVRALETQGIDTLFLAMGYEQAKVIRRFSQEVIAPLRTAS